MLSPGSRPCPRLSRGAVCSTHTTTTTTTNASAGSPHASASAATERTRTAMRQHSRGSSQSGDEPKSDEPKKLDGNPAQQVQELLASPPLTASSSEFFEDTNSASSSTRTSITSTTTTATSVSDTSDIDCPGRHTGVLSAVDIPTISISPAPSRRTNFSQIVEQDSLASSADSPTDTQSITSSPLKPLSALTSTLPTNSNNNSQPATASSSSWWKFGLGIKDMALTGDSPPRGGSKIGTWWAGNSSSTEFTSSPARSSRLLSSASTTSTITASPEAPAIARLKKSHTIGSMTPTPADLNDPSSRRNSSSSAFSFITSSMSALSRLTQHPNTHAPDDELCNMNIETALSTPTTSSSLEEQHSLKDTATHLLIRFQTAYRAQSSALRDIQAERSAEREELAGMTARARHLQARLEDAARRAAEQEEALMACLEELTAEKKARIECEQAAREKGVVLVRRDLDEVVGGGGEGESVLTEDLGVDEDQRRRRWIMQQGVGEGGKGDGFETDEESFEGGSVFSRSRSPTLPPGGSITEAAATATAIDSSPSSSPIQGKNAATTSIPPKTTPVPFNKPRGVHHQQQQQPQRLSAFQKILKGIAGDGEDGNAAARGQAASCANCRGGDARVAWDTVSLLRDENKGLKQTVAALESAVEGALDVVNRVGM